MSMQFLDNVQSAVQFVIAIGSLVGWFIVVISVIGLIFTNHKFRTRLIWYIVMGGILIILCGPITGFQYFFFN